jgi:hypothetical protein
MPSVVKLRQRNRDAVRRWRARVSKCQAASWVDYDSKVVDVMIKRRYIAEYETGDRAKMRQALTLLLLDYVAEDIRKNFPELS